MKYYFLFVLVPLLIFNIIRKKRQREEAAQKAEQVKSTVAEAMREAELMAQKAPPPTPKAPEKPVVPVQAMKPEPAHREGKRPAEIQEDRLQLLALEHANAEMEETRREIREMDLRRLRRAVVMSEILDRPVSLRKHGYR